MHRNQQEKPEQRGCNRRKRSISFGIRSISFAYGLYLLAYGLEGNLLLVSGMVNGKRCGVVGVGEIVFRAKPL
jgi:hypothetical protein